MSETLYQRTERAWFLAVDLDVSVGHLQQALMDLTEGRIGECHWALWRGGFTKIQPGWRAQAQEAS